MVAGTDHVVAVHGQFQRRQLELGHGQNLPEIVVQILRNRVPFPFFRHRQFDRERAQLGGALTHTLFKRKVEL